MEVFLSFLERNKEFSLCILVGFIWILNLIRLMYRPPQHCSCQEPTDEEEP